MATSAGTAFIDLVADPKSFGASVNKAVTGASSSIGSKISSIGSKLGGVFGVALGTTALVKLGKAAIDQAEEAQTVGRQTAAVLESTGGAANVTADQVANLANSLSDVAAVDDEVIAQGENVLLTFTKVRNEAGKGNDIFNQATTAALDLSAAMGMDLQSAIVLVGKALNDPIKGLTSLTRAGIQFTDAQKDQIKTLVESGHTLEAQKIILGELKTEFGGAAEANVTASKKFGVAIGNIEETLGQILLPILNVLATVLGKIPTPLSAVALGFGALAIAIKLFGGNVAEVFSKLAAAVPELAVLAAALITVKFAIDAVTAAFSGDWSRFFDVEPQIHAVHHFADVIGVLTPAMTAARTEMQHTIETTQEVQTAAEQAAFAEAGLSDAMKDLNDQMRTAWSLENQLAGGLLGLVSADADATQARRDFAAAQAKVNRLTENGKKDTKAYRDAIRDRNDAELASLESQQNLEGSAQSLYAEFRKGNVSLKEADDRLRAQAAAAGLSKSQTEALVTKVNALYKADSKIPPDVITNFTAPGLDSEMSSVVAYWTKLKDIPTHIDVFITTHYEQTGNPTTKGPAV